MTRPSSTDPHRPTEADLVADLVRLLRRQWPLRALALEVRSHGRCRTDACFLVRDVGACPPLLVGVEAKLFDWARAVAQATMNRYAVDLSYVALPGARVSAALLEDARRHGVGVLAVGRDRLEVAQPAVPNATDPVLRTRVLSQLTAVRARGHAPTSQLSARLVQVPGAAEGAA